MSKKHFIGDVLMLASVPSMIGQFNMNNIKILRDMGYNVYVACNFQDRSVCDETEINDLKKKLANMQIKLIDIVASRHVMDIKAHLHTYKQLKTLFTKKNFTFIHCHTPIVSALARMAARKHTKVIYTAHGFHFFTGSPWRNWIFFYPIERWLSRFTDILITINKEDYRRAQTFHARKVVYIPGVGLDVDHFHKCDISRMEKRRELNISENAIVLLSVGELSARKNHEVIIRALSQIKRKDIVYCIAGIGNLKEEYCSMIHTLGLQTKVLLLGNRTDVDELCKMSDIFVHPSVREGLGIAALEGMASGLPLICSDINGIKDYAINGVTGYCLAPHDISGFSHAIIKLANVKELRHTMGHAAYMASRAFDIRNTEQIMRRVYKTGM